MTDRRGGNVSDDWYAGAFDALYPLVYAHRNTEAAAPEAEFAALQTQLSAEEALLDLCCGNGRHLAHLARRTRHAVGLDYSTDLLGLANKHLARAAALVRGDMRALPFAPASFDVVTNFFTSFGYFANDAENQGVLCEIERILRAGGRFLIDFLNPSSVRRGLLPKTCREVDGYTIFEERWLVSGGERVNKKTTVFASGACVASSEESVRLYDERAMRAMLDAARLDVIAVFGDYTGAAPHDNSPRRIYVGCKRACA